MGSHRAKSRRESSATSVQARVGQSGKTSPSPFDRYDDEKRKLGHLPQKLCDARDGNLVLARLQGEQQIERGDERSEIVFRNGSDCRSVEEISSSAQIAAKTTADHDRTGPISTDFDSNKIPISRGCCCIVTDGNLAGTHS